MREVLNAIIEPSISPLGVLATLFTMAATLVLAREWKRF